MSSPKKRVRASIGRMDAFAADRKQVLSIVTEHPGVTVQQIADMMEKTYSSVLGHMKKLLDEELIHSVKRQRISDDPPHIPTIYYPGTDPELVKARVRSIPSQWTVLAHSFGMPGAQVSA